MNTHQKKLLNTIQEFCKEYIEQKIDLPTLQSLVEAVYSNFENDMDPQIIDTVFNFTAKLEDIRFMNNDEEHFQLVSDEIKILSSFINQF